MKYMFCKQQLIFTLSELKKHEGVVTIVVATWYGVSPVTLIKTVIKNKVSTPFMAH